MTSLTKTLHKIQRKRSNWQFKDTRQKGDGYEVDFKAYICDGPWWSTTWRGTFTINQEFLVTDVYLDVDYTHPHISSSGRLCVHRMPDSTLSTYVGAIETLWQEVNVDDAYNLSKCLKDLRKLEKERADYDATTENRLATYRFIVRAAKELDKSDAFIAKYKSKIDKLNNSDNYSTDNYSTDHAVGRAGMYS